MGRGPNYSKQDRYYLVNLIQDNPHVCPTELAKMAIGYGMFQSRSETAIRQQICTYQKELAKPNDDNLIKEENKALKQQSAELQQDLNTLKDAIIGGLHLREDKHGNLFVALTYGPVKKVADEIWHTEFNTRISELYQEEGTDAYQLKLL